MVEIKQSRSEAETIARRLRNSGDTDNADRSVVHGTGPTRTYTNIHHSGHQGQHGADNPGEGDINNRPRGSANSKGEI